MLRTLPALGLALSAIQGISAQDETTLPAVLDAGTIASLGNNSIFTRWRPISHFSAPAGWMNVRLSSSRPVKGFVLLTQLLGPMRHDVRSDKRSLSYHVPVASESYRLGYVFLNNWHETWLTGGRQHFLGVMIPTV